MEIFSGHEEPASEDSLLGRRERDLLRNGRNCLARDRNAAVSRDFVGLDEGLLGGKPGLNGWR